MKITKIVSLLIVIAAAAAIVRAQDETIVLSPFSVSSAKRSEKPPVVLKKRADFLLLQISLVNDSREEDRRREEVYGTLKSMVKAVPVGSRIELFTEEFTLSSSHFQIPLVDVSDKRDTSGVTLYAKVPLTETDDVGGLAENLRCYVSSIKGEGRTEIFGGDLGLSIKNPERYRYEVVQAVATDIKRLREAFGDSFEIVVTGLDSRLQWERTSISEVELYLPVNIRGLSSQGRQDHDGEMRRANLDASAKGYSCHAGCSAHGAPAAVAAGLQR